MRARMRQGVGLLPYSPLRMQKQEARKSQSALPQRKWNSSIRYSLGLSEPMKNREGYSAFKGTHPLSTIPSRPESQAAEFSPTSHLRQSVDRPRSTVRPLSGRVFMRCSSKHGWVAKAYPETQSSSSQPNLDNYSDDMLQSESLDSFFDDEFEEEDEVGKLGNLLSCNTLGVEARGTKQDWVSGDVDIPQFHCPRCRDHWYGISSYPCDEELARLIREGMWKTGNVNTSTSQKRKSREFSLNQDKVNERQTNTSHTNISLKAKLPKLRQHVIKSNGKVSGTSWSWKREEGVKKKKKRITFQLDNSQNEVSGSGTSLEEGEYESLTSKEDAGIKCSDSLGYGEGGRGNGEVGEDVGRHGSWRNVEGNEERSPAGLGEGKGGAEDRGGGGEGRDGRKVDERRGTMPASDGEEGSEVSERGRPGNTGNTITAQDVNNNSMSNEERRAGDRGPRHGEGPGINRRGDGSGDGGDGKYSSDRYSSDSYNSDLKTGGMKEGLGNESNSGTRQGIARNTTGNDGVDDESKSSSLGNKTHHGGLSTKNKEGSGVEVVSEFIQAKDYGKRIRKTGGYMRAVSPTSSEWGDPLHARSFISNTAMSRTGSNSDLTELDNKYDSKSDSNNKRFLPPIVHPIHRPQPSTMGYHGPDITRPWTFSYHL